MQPYKHVSDLSSNVEHFQNHLLVLVPFYAHKEHILHHLMFSSTSRPDYAS